MPVSPLRPEDLAQAKADVLPDYVIEAINGLLVVKLCFKQDEAIEAILAKGPEDLTRSNIFDRDYLDFEPVYREAGWHVIYDTPAYCESNRPATFTFSRGKS